MRPLFLALLAPVCEETCSSTKCPTLKSEITNCGNSLEKSHSLSVHLIPTSALQILMARLLMRLPCIPLVASDAVELGIHIRRRLFIGEEQSIVLPSHG